jgi:hypothetical protein
MLLTYNPPRRRYRIPRTPRLAFVRGVAGIPRLAAVRRVTGIPRLAVVRGVAGTPRLTAVRWLTALTALIGVSAMVLLPWTVYLASSLPPSITARHWPLVWGGLDGAIAAGLAATALLAIRRDRRIALVAVSTATLLLADAWFDVCTSPSGRALAWAILDMGVEAAEAAACLLLAAAVYRHRPTGHAGEAPAGATRHGGALGRQVPRWPR